MGEFYETKNKVRLKIKQLLLAIFIQKCYNIYYILLLIDIKHCRDDTMGSERQDYSIANMKRHAMLN